MRVGGGKDVLFGIMGGGGTRARAAAGSALTPGAGGIGAGGSGRVTRDGAISLSLSLLMSSAESAGARGSPSACVFAAPKSSVASWLIMVLGGLGAAASLASLSVSELLSNSAACVNVSTSPSCTTRVCASSKSIAPSNCDSSPKACCNGACAWGSDSMKRTKILHQRPV